MRTGLAWLAATCGLVCAYCRPAGDRWSAGGAAALFALYHLSGGVWRAGQRDFLLCLLLLAGAYAVARGAEAGASGPLALGGLVLGAAIMIKPRAALFWVLCAGLASAGCGPTRSIGRAAGVVLGTGLVVPAIVFGGWPAGADWPRSATSSWAMCPPVRSRGRTSVVEAWVASIRPSALVPVPPARDPGPAGRTHGADRRAWPRRAPSTASSLFRAGKGWSISSTRGSLPLALAPWAVSGLRPIGWPRALDLWGARRSVGLAIWALLVIVLGAKGVDAREPDWITAKAARVAALTRDLAPLVPAGGTVQVLDTTSGGIHALLRLGLRQPTRFIYDFHFFHDQDAPRMSRTCARR